MRIIKQKSDANPTGCEKITDVLLSIAGEMVNITYNTKYFDDGKVLDKPVSPYNVYTIDSVKYQLHPNVGCIYMNCSSSDRQFINTNLRDRFNELVVLVTTKFGVPKINPATSSTTQYLIVNTQEPPIANTIEISASAKITDKRDKLFNWFMMADSSFPPTAIAGRLDNNIEPLDIVVSLSSIFYDGIDSTSLPHNFRGPNHPELKDLVLFQQDLICNEPIYVHPNLGLLDQIAIDYGQKVPAKWVFTQLSNVGLRFVKWEWLKPYEPVDGIDMGPANQIKNGIFNKSVVIDEGDADLLEKSKRDGTARYKCFMTGLPIYEDCYVFDIYEQQLEIYIEKKDLVKYPGATVVEDDSEPEPDTKTKPKPKPKSIKKKKNRGAGGARAIPVNGNESESLSDSSDDEAAEESKLATADAPAEIEEKTYTRGRKSSKKTPAKKPPVKKAETKPNAVIRRGQQYPVEYVKIRYVVEYNEPKCILVSPFAVHRMGCNLEVFEKLTGTKAMIYRTVCPVTLYTVIEEAKVSNVKRKILHAFNIGFQYKNRCLEADGVLVANSHPSADLYQKRRQLDTILAINGY